MNGGQEPASDGWKRHFLGLARASIRSALALPPRPTSPPPTEPMIEARGTFVTLRVDGHLRGRMGMIKRRTTLSRTIERMASAAATEDPRFPPLSVDELDSTRIEISLLGPLSPVEPGAVEVGEDGLVVEGTGRRGLLLPEVAVERGMQRVEFIEATVKKAGLPADALSRGATLSRFSTRHFAEGEG